MPSREMERFGGETGFSKTPDEWILSGPHFYVGNPFFQTPKTVCNTHRAYDVL